MKSVILTLIVFGVLYCKNSTSVSSCELLTKSLNDKRIVNYLHPDIKDREVVYLIENSFCSLNKKINSVEIKTVSKEIALKNKNYIELKSLYKTGNDLPVLIMIYPIEGVSFTVLFDTSGNISTIRIIEK